MPVSFDKSMTDPDPFAGDEMFLSLRRRASLEVPVRAMVRPAYSFMRHHVVGGTINTIEYGTRGGWVVRSATDYFVGGSAQLKITGLELTATPVAGHRDA